MTRLLFGCGYLGRRVADRWLARGETVVAVTRRPERAAALRQAGIHPIVADVTRPATLAELPAAETVLYCVGFDPRAGIPRRELTVVGLANVLDALPEPTGKILYISSTGVIGNHRGEWVDEESPCLPEREGGIVGLQAEELLRNHGFAARTVILRLAGIYGPNRIPKLADVRSGRPVAAPDGSWLNLIHVDDAVEVVLAAEDRAKPPRTYLVSDGHPTAHRQFYREIAQRLQVAPPRFVQPEPGSRGAAAALGNKRVSNGRMLEELGVSLRFPSYREGLVDLLAESEQSPSSDP